MEGVVGGGGVVVRGGVEGVVERGGVAGWRAGGVVEGGGGEGRGREGQSNQKRYAVASALAASALSSLVLARGHKVSQVAEVPCVVSNATESVQRTKQAIAALKAVGAYADVEKVKASRKIRAGKGKMRNRRHVQRNGPLVASAMAQARLVGRLTVARVLPGTLLRFC